MFMLMYCIQRYRHAHYTCTCTLPAEARLYCTGHASYFLSRYGKYMAESWKANSPINRPWSASICSAPDVTTRKLCAKKNDTPNTSARKRCGTSSRKPEGGSCGCGGGGGGSCGGGGGEGGGVCKHSVTS